MLPGADAALLAGNVNLHEPLVGYEYVRDCAGLVHKRGMVNVLVTNGTIEEAPWRQLLPLIDAVNIDLKGFTSAWYRRLGGDLDTVKRSIALAEPAGKPDPRALADGLPSGIGGRIGTGAAEFPDIQMPAIGPAPARSTLT